MDSIAKKIRNILVATDFSENADFAILRAIDIAKKCNATITILHVIQKKSMDKFLDDTLKKLLPKGLWLTTEEYQESILQEKLLSLLRHNLNINYFIIPKGKPAQKILIYAKKHKMDLLVLGAHGKYSLRDTFVGTTAEYIVKHTNCAVLIVKNKPKKDYRKILVPIDFSVVSKRALNYAFNLFQNSKVSLLHVGDYEYENILKEKEKEIKKSKFLQIKKALFSYLENNMKKFIRGYNKKLDKKPYHILLGYPGPTIINEASKLKPDIIVMGTQGHGRIHYFFIGSVANWVLTESKYDILLVPPKVNK